jgi:hypothetical protein
LYISILLSCVTGTAVFDSRKAAQALNPLNPPPPPPLKDEANILVNFRKLSGQE